MKKTILAILASVLSLTAAAKPAKTVSTPHGYMTAGYVHFRQVKPDMDFENISRIDRVYFFGMSPDKEGNFYIKDGYLEALEKVKAAIRPEQQLLLVLGGGADVANMHVMGDDPVKRRAFAKATVKFAREHGFDGIDMDWETDWKAKKDVDTEALRDLLKMIRKGLPKGSLLTAALGSSPHSARQTKDILDLVDDVSIMIYSSLNSEGLHAPLYEVQSRMRRFEDLGIPKDRLLIGVPFYGIAQEKKDGRKVSKRYYDILPMLPDGDTSTGVVDGISFNCVDEMKAKRNWVVEQGYKGIMIWEMCYDVPYSNPRSLTRTLVEYRVPEKRDFIVAGYLHASWVKPGMDLEFLKHIDRLYFFGMRPAAEGTFTVSDHYLWALDTARKVMGKDKELLIALGGGASNAVVNMYTMGTDPVKRDAYAAAVGAFVREHGADGVDMDWEGSGRLGCKVPTPDVCDLGRKLRKYMPEGSVLTAALSRRKDCAEQGAALIEIVDDISVMLYGQLHPKTHLQTPLPMVAEILEWYRAAGIPNSKIVPGVSFYGQVMDQPKGQPKKTVLYRDLEPRLEKGDVTTHVLDGVSFSSVRDMKEKRDWYKAEGYKGIMIWELTQDAPYSCPRSLLRAINEQ